MANFVVSGLENLDSLSHIMHIILLLYQHSLYPCPRMLDDILVGQGLYVIYMKFNQFDV